MRIITSKNKNIFRKMSTKINKSLILNEIKSYYNFVSDSEFAKFLGIKPQTLSSWHTRNTFDIELLYSKCENINAEYLLTGIGDIEKPNVEKKLHSESVTKSVTNNVTNQKYKKGYTNEEPPYNIVSLPSNRKTKDAVYPIQEIPLYDLEATAGLKELFSGGKSATQVLDTIKIPHLPKCDGAISITGDSMYPLLKSGDMVLYKEVPLDSIFYGEMYLLAYQIDDWEEYITVKYVQKSELGDDYLKLVSQNQHHQPRNVKKAQITAIAIIKASIRINTMM